MKKLTKRQIESIKNKLAKVENMVSSKGNLAPNQFIIYTEKATIFQSYSTIIAMKTHNGIVLDVNAWDYSVTTGKYRNQFLREGIAETRAKIESGEYQLADLN